MSSTIEIISRMEEAAPADTLLYTPRHDGATARRSRVYHAEVEGDHEAFLQWMRRVVLDEVSQEFRVGGHPAFEDATVLEFGMKPGALDHEREMILEEYRREAGEEGVALGFTLRDLRVGTRYYLFAPEPGAAVDAAPFVRDVVNPAIHRWEVVG